MSNASSWKGSGGKGRAATKCRSDSPSPPCRSASRHVAGRRLNVREASRCRWTGSRRTTSGTARTSMDSGSPLGVKTAASNVMRMTAQRHQSSSLAGVTTPASCRATRTTGNSNVSPKSTIMSRIRLRYWFGLRICLRLGPPTTFKKCNACGKMRYAISAPRQEEHDRRDDERHGVALLVRPQARGDEAPHLPEDHRRGQDQPAEGRHLDAQREAVERAGDVEAAVVRVDVTVGVAGAARAGGCRRRPPPRRRPRRRAWR